LSIDMRYSDFSWRTRYCTVPAYHGASFWRDVVL